MWRIEQLIQDETGLHSGAIGSNSIARAIRARMKTVGLRKTEDYLDLVQSSPFERNELVESVVVTETWFFRDAPAFTAAATIVRDELIPTRLNRPARLLSLPCSSGEEPYSLAMAMLDAGVPASQFRILAADISSRSLARAQRGVFGRNSFRGKDLAFRDKYFRAVDREFALEPTVLSCVHFHQFNLLGEEISSLPGLFDIVFCRNLMIYFDLPTQKMALDRIGRFLAPGGALFVGPAEQPFVLEQGYVSAHIPMAFACRNPGHLGRIGEPRPVRSPQPDHPGKMQQPATRVPPARSIGTPARRSHSQAEAETAPTIAGELERARRLADEGKLAEASALCDRHLREKGASAQAYFLIALIRDAAGDSTATEFYRKAIYLDPNHYESLMHLALSLEKNGEKIRARTYRNRAQRLKPKP
jgi:chemotaxis protein methyltransferase WspC